ncbi:phospholipase D family protein [Nodosilinea sp. LEGE 07088]|nr:phospholipase D family protein [Nodosilinea sp. LEGE 07088]
MIEIGHQLQQLCRSAKKELWLVAPFIKLGTLTQLLQEVDAHICINCVTRWRPEDVLAGVSDLTIWPSLCDRPNTSLWLRQNLHAKYYRADSQCLVGSANLTQTALGWSPSSNLELLIPVFANDPVLQAFEQELNRNKTQVDDELYEQMQVVVEQLQQSRPDANWIAPDLPRTLAIPEQALAIKPETWVPTLRNPEALYLAYSGQQERLTSASREAAQSDLLHLSIPLSLTKPAFTAYVGFLLLQMPIVQSVDQFVETPQRFGAVTDLLESLPCADIPEFNSDRVWQTLMRWLRHFLPDRYALAVPNYSEVFYRVKKNSTSENVIG